MRHSTITDNGTLVSLDDPKKRIAVLEAERDKALSDMNRNAEIVFELAATRDALRHKVAKYIRAARHYRFTRRAARGAVHDMWKTQTRLITAEKLLRGVRDFAPVEYQSTIDTFLNSTQENQ